MMTQLDGGGGVLQEEVGGVWQWRLYIGDGEGGQHQFDSQA